MKRKACIQFQYVHKGYSLLRCGGLIFCVFEDRGGSIRNVCSFFMLVPSLEIWPILRNHCMKNYEIFTIGHLQKVFYKGVTKNYRATGSGGFPFFGLKRIATPLGRGSKKVVNSLSWGSKKVATPSSQGSKKVTTPLSRGSKKVVTPLSWGGKKVMTPLAG